jgi:hypothetical protein
VKNLGIILLLLVCCALPARAVGGVAVDPSRDQFGARQLGMGGVSAAFGGDATALFGNPGSLTGFEFPQLTAASRKLLIDETQYNFLAWALPTDYGTFGLGYVGMEIGGSLPTYLDPATGRILQNPSQEVGGYENSVIALSYCRDLSTPVKISLGGNLKIFNQSLAGGGYNERGTGLSLDLGASYRYNRWLNLGANLQNILGGSINWSGSADKLGGYYKLGSKVNLLGTTEEALFYDREQKLFAGLDIDLPNNVPSAGNSLFYYHLGCEYFPVKNIALRGGINQEVAGSGLTLGIGLTNGGFRFDYAYYQRPGLAGDTPHYFSLSYVGERVLTYDRKLKKKVSQFRVALPKERLITDLFEVDVSAEGFSELVIDQKRIWTVTAVSATSDAFEVTTTEALASAFINGHPVSNPSHFAQKEPLHEGRNVISLVGFPSGEVTPSSTEIHVLQIEPFKDTPVSFWAIEPIMLSGILGLVSGYPDNTFKPDKGITRAELVTLLVKSLPIRTEELDALATEEVFSDVKAKHWATKYVVCGNQQGFVTGYKDGTFKPNKVLNRAEGVVILARYAKLAEASGLKEPPFPDLKPDFWANKFIEPAQKIKMLDYLASKEFKPGEIFTRAEACEILYRVPAVKERADEWWKTGVVSGAH